MNNAPRNDLNLNRNSIKREVDLDIWGVGPTVTQTLAARSNRLCGCVAYYAYLKAINREKNTQKVK